MVRYSAVADNSAALGALALRWAHLAACVLVAGAATALLLPGPSERPTVRAWARATTRALGAALVVALVTGLGTLVARAWALGPAAADRGAPPALDTVLGVALDTTAGRATLARLALLTVAGAVVLAAPPGPSRRDWLAVRGHTVLGALAALGTFAATGHAAGLEPAAPALAASGLHLAAAGLWLGALGPLAALFGRAARPAGADARPAAVLAARRFSRLALGAVVVLAVTGLVHARLQVDGAAGLLGTPYGRILLAKLGLLGPLLALAWVSRRRLLPALGGEAASVGRPAMARLARTVAVEGALGILVLGAAAALAVTPPARHVDPAWPLPFRLAAPTGEAARARALAGSQLAVLGLAALLTARAARRARLVPAGAALLAAGAALALPALATEAVPTSFRRPAVPYDAASIARGARSYATHCAGCHGADARGLVDAAARLTAGEIVWRVAHGTRDGRMPALADRLDEAARWDVVNFLRLVEAARGAARLDAPGAPPRLVAPDFAFAVGPVTGALRDYRGRYVLLVLHAWPDSRPRLTRLAEAHARLGGRGVEVLAVPRDAAPDAIRRLGDGPPVLFPVVTAGAEAILAAYAPLAPAPHTELLVDRHGYLRARWRLDPGAPGDVAPVLARVAALDAEPAPPGPPAHAH